MTIRCTLFSYNLEHIDNAFQQGDMAVIVLTDTHKVISMMDRAMNHYVHPAKIDLHSKYLRNGHFEIPLIALSRAGKIQWIEGIHQVNAAFENGQGVIPLSTAPRYAQAIKNLVGADDPALARAQFDFSECREVEIY